MTDIEIAIKVVGKITGIPSKTILSKNRTHSVVEGRMLIILLLKGDGKSDELIGWMLKRSRVAILGMRNVATDLLTYSKSFRDKYQKAHESYVKQKSIRNA